MQTERIGLAALTAVVGTLVAAALLRTGRLPVGRRLPLQLPAGDLVGEWDARPAGRSGVGTVGDDAPAIEVAAVAVRRTSPAASAGVSSHFAPEAASRHTPRGPAGPTTARPDGAGEPRDRLARLATAVSLLSTGALLTLVVLWASGTFDGRPATSPPAVPIAAAGDLPVTAADLTDAEPTDADLADDGRRQTVGANGLAQAAGTGDVGTDTIAEVPRQVADPVRIDIPAIGVAADVIPLGSVADTGELEVPTDFAQTGWWTGGPEPGEPGPAVIAGHVDSYQGPAVFFDLQRLTYDDLIRVTRADGTAATFAVRETIAVDKDDFPTEFVYGPTDRRLLRLITCDGEFTGDAYQGNLIVTAELLAEHPAPVQRGLTG